MKVRLSNGYDGELFLFSGEAYWIYDIIRRQTIGDSFQTENLALSFKNLFYPDASYVIVVSDTDLERIENENW